MRIGEVNKDNYKFFLQMLGAKSSKALDALMGEDKEEKTNPLFGNRKNNVVVDANYLEGMTINEGDDLSNFHRIVPVSDEIRNKIIDTVRKQFLRNGNGATKPVVDTKEFATINFAYLKDVSPSERLAVTWTLSHIRTDEERRLVNYVKEQDPTWKPGQKFDKDILLKSNFGTNSVDVKA